MKKTAIIGTMAAALLGGLATTSCDDMLTVDTGDKSYVNANDTLYSYLGILRGVQNIAERYVILGEIRGDLVAPTTYATDTLHAIATFDDAAKDGTCSMLSIRDYYNVINNCNLYIANADTSAIKSNVQYMLPEYRQVQAIRAWTYLQLVQNYGEVPFITEPVSSLDVIDKFDINDQANLVNKDNLADKFIALGLDKYAALDSDIPHYGNYENGAVNIASRLCLFQSRLILGDMYLLRGQSKADYLKAAQYYYDYLYDNTAYVPEQYVTVSKNRLSDTYEGSTRSSWGAWAGTYAYTASGENITYIPSSSNTLFGTILSRPANIFGYTTSSSQSSDESTNDDGDTEYSTSGAISVTTTYKRQFAPSDAYQGLSDEQTYVVYTNNNSRRETYESGDARSYVATSSVTYEGESYPLCSKAARGRNFYYTIPVYRKTLVWLRFAEAINRAGYPQVAFAVLKDGLSPDNFPRMSYRYKHFTVVDNEGNPLLDADGNPVTGTDTIQYMYYPTNGAMYYVDSTEVVNFPFDFSAGRFDRNYGIHARGCGFGSWNSENSTASYVTSITGYNDSIDYTLDALCAAQGLDATAATEDQLINAVENIISDELALESSFEGNRFTDLVRMAQHKNQSGFDGTTWIAAKIADRGVRKDKEDDTVTVGQRDQSIFSKLLNPANWYLTKPEWTK